MRIIMVVAVLVVLTTVVSAQESPRLTGWVEAQGTVQDGSVTPQINALLDYKISKEFGLFAFGQTSESYSQVYAGPTWAPKDWLQLGVGIGVEKAKNPARVGGFVWAGKGRVSTLLLVEDGGSGFWYKNQTNLALKKGVTVGFQSQRFAGTGVHVEFQIPKTRLMAWTSVLGQKSGPVLQTGIRYSF